MTEEQKDEIKGAIARTRAACDDVETMLADYDQCKSDTSRKYLAAAIVKTAAAFRQQAS